LGFRLAPAAGASSTCISTLSCLAPRHVFGARACLPHRTTCFDALLERMSSSPHACAQRWVRGWMVHAAGRAMSLTPPWPWVPAAAATSPALAPPTCAAAAPPPTGKRARPVAVLPLPLRCTLPCTRALPPPEKCNQPPRWSIRLSAVLAAVQCVRAGGRAHPRGGRG